jgi:hypothetical protein
LVIEDFNRDGKLDIASVMVTVNTPLTQGVQYLATFLGDGAGAFGARAFQIGAAGDSYPVL